MSSTASTTSEIQSTRAPSSVDPLIEALRDAVYRRDPEAAPRAVELASHFRSLAARAELLSTLETGPGGAGSSAQLLAAAQALGQFQPQDAETRVDLAVAQLLTDSSPTAIDEMSESIDAVAAGQASPAGLVYAANRLADEHRDSDTFALLALILSRLAQATPASEARSITALERVGLGQLETTSKSPRRLLRRVLELIDRLLETRPDSLDLLGLRAQGLVVSGKFDDGKQAAEAVLTLDAENVNARWVKIAALVALGENEEALAECTTLPSELVGAPDAVTLRVQLLASVDRYDDALKVADRAIAGGAVGVELALARAEVLVDAEHWDEALASLQALGADHPERPEPLRRRAYVLRRTGRDDEAIETLSALLSDHPTDIEALKQLAELYTERGNETAALSALDRALAVAPGRADLVLARSRVLHRTGHAVEALQSVEQALGSDPRDPEAAAFKGQILAELGRREEAAAAYLEASGRASVTKQDQAPYVAAVEAIADQLLGERKYDAALRIVESWPAALRSGDLAGLRAELWRVTGRLREAIAETDAAIAAGAEPIWMAGTKADAMVQLARSQEGLSLIEDALAENETYQFGQITRLSALNELNRVTDAMQVLDQHLSEGEGAEPYATTARSSLLINLGRFDECIRLIEQSGQVAESAGMEAESAGTEAGAEWLSRLGAAYHRVGRFEAAIDSLRRTVELSHPDVEAWVLTELADALMRQPDSAAEARAHYERALTINNGQQRIRAALESAWALWRLGRVEPALESYRAAFDRAKDPLTFDRLRYVLLLSLVAPGPAAEAALDEILGRVTQLEDRACASGVLADGRHVCAMLLADATWANRAERLRVAESHLQAEVTRR